MKLMRLIDYSNLALNRFNDEHAFEDKFHLACLSRIEAGRIVMKATGYDDGAHWTGERVVGAEEDPFWRWCFLNRQIFSPILSENYITGVRRFWETEIAGGKLETECLVPPDDGNYVFRLPSSKDSEIALATLFKRFGKNAFTSLSDLIQPSLNFRFLICFCGGFSEVFCFRGAKCDYFAPLGEDLAVLPQYLDLLEKRIPRKD